MTLRVLELFGGIGACSKALERLGIDYEIADYVEIDKYAVKSFNAIHGTNFDPQDICEWNKNISVDLIMHGSPCQDFSVAGKNAGGDEGSGTRSSLMYETLRIVDQLRPKYVLWENVKNLLSTKHKPNWDRYCHRMTEMGYINTAKVLNAKDYGIPQNRERVYTLSIRKDVAPAWRYEFPEPIPLEKRLKDVLESNVDEKYYLSDAQVGSLVVQSDNLRLPGAYGREFGSKGKIQDVNEPAPTMQAAMGEGGGNIPLIKVGELNIKGNDQIKRVYSPDGASPTLSTMQGGNRQPKITNGLRIRKLTPKECWRLMGFDDSDFEKAAKVNSNAQLYKQAGNSIVVDVLVAILRELLCK